jgi:hypothetical protein
VQEDLIVGTILYVWGYMPSSFIKTISKSIEVKERLIGQDFG